MSNGNKKGPDNKGPRTGRGLGGCKPVKGEKLQRPRRGTGRRRTP